MKRAKQNIEEPSKVRVTFYSQNKKHQSSHELQIDTAMSDVIDRWTIHCEANSLKSEAAWLELRFPKAGKAEFIRLVGYNRERIFIEFNFDIDSMRSGSSYPHHKHLYYNESFNYELKVRKKIIEDIFGFKNLKIEWGNPRTWPPKGKKDETTLGVYFDSDEAWLHIRTKIDLLDFDRSLQISDLQSITEKMNRILSDLIQVIRENDIDLDQVFLDKHRFHMFSLHGEEAARSIVRAAWDKLENNVNKISGKKMSSFLFAEMQKVATQNRVGRLNHPEIWDTEPRDEIKDLVAKKAIQLGYDDKEFYYSIWDYYTEDETNDNECTGFEKENEFVDEIDKLTVRFRDLDCIFFLGTFTHETPIVDIANILKKEDQGTREDILEGEKIFVELKISKSKKLYNITMRLIEGELHIYSSINIEEILKVQSWELARAFFDEQLENWRKTTQELFGASEIEIPWFTETIKDLQIGIQINISKLNTILKISDLENSLAKIASILDISPDTREKLQSVNLNEKASLLSVSFVGWNEEYIYSTTTPVYSIIDYWIKQGEDFESMHITIELPNGKEWEEIWLMGTDDNKLLFIYYFNIDELISSDEECIDDELDEFEIQLESNRKQLESVLKVFDLFIDLAGQDSSNNIPNELGFSFDEVACLNLKITLDLKDLNKSMKIADLIDNFNNINAIVNNINPKISR